MSTRSAARAVAIGILAFVTPAAGAVQATGAPPSEEVGTQDCNPRYNWCPGSVYPNEHQCIVAKNAMSGRYWVKPSGSWCYGTPGSYSYYYSGPR